MPPSRPVPTLPPDFTVTATSQLTSLWSNYGHTYRLHLSSQPNSLILKSIHPPVLDHPDESHLRKLLSYDIERWFYHSLAKHVPPTVKLARPYPVLTDNEHNLLLEDLSVEFPFPARGSLGREGTICVLKWLAGFHGTFFQIYPARGSNGAVPPLIPPPNKWKQGSETAGIWQRGTYWYLETRRKELAEINEEEYGWLLPWVEKVNDAVDREIHRYGTLVHGDVKGENIVFNQDLYSRRKGKPAAKAETSTELKCALYDLQYVGLGLPALDLVYFLGTSVESSLLSSHTDEKALLETYHAVFLESLSSSTSKDGNDPMYDFETFWKHWEFAIVDWYRFMAGWGFWGNDRWTERRAREIVMKWKAAKVEQL
ncbi:hypothetical protein PHLCEN_2v9178 [Hermanssonia centrifuga]|uniref:CHK kinase-like domain-containing protein n=1 Tax=Hermanssonia centrifuga TaxID=98765 RepID=A0A2R6NRH5_9APHY|nr:hypothetical protein PHLCEN_2v9178 [Hermanssonia centrifuga]